MLTYEQLRHFAEHGWVLEENVLSPEQMRPTRPGWNGSPSMWRPLAHEDNDELSTSTAWSTVTRSSASGS